jgi:hypothetical protein
VHTFAFALGSAGGQRSDAFIREQVIRTSLDLELVVRLHRRSPIPPPFARDAARTIREEVDVVIEAGGQTAADRSQGVGIAATGGLRPPAQLLHTVSSVEWLVSTP